MIEVKADAPTPTKAPNAAAKFIKGKVKAKPDIAKAPTPCPMNILSTTLNKLDAICAIIAGVAYCNNKVPIFSLPKIKAFSSFTFIIVCKITKK